MDHETAFSQYQTVHGKLVGLRLKGLPLVARLLVPRTRLGISVRNRFVAVAGASYLAALRIGRRMGLGKPPRA